MGEVLADGAMRGRKVLFFISYPQRMAGANRSLFELVRALRGRCELLVVLTAEGPVAEAYRAEGIRILVVPTAPNLGRYGQVLLRAGYLQKLRTFCRYVVPYAMRFVRLLRDEKVDLVHVNDMRGGLMVGWSARILGIPLVGHVRGEQAVGGVLAAIYELLAQRLITVAEYVRESLGYAGRQKAVTVYNGIGAVAVKPASFPWLRRRKADGVVVVSCFASIIPYKGHKTLIEALAILNAKGFGDKLILLCIGDFVAEYAWYQELLEEYRRRVGVDNVIFTGWQADPFPFYEIADICSLVSVNSGSMELLGRTIPLKGGEGFPRTLLEGMVFGLPVVASANAGILEQVVDGETGYIVPSLDAAALADAIERLCLSQPLRASLGSAGQQRVKKLFSTEAYRDGVLRVYDELLQR